MLSLNQRWPKFKKQNDDERSGIVDGFKGCIEHCEGQSLCVESILYALYLPYGGRSNHMYVG